MLVPPPPVPAEPVPPVDPEVPEPPDVPEPVDGDVPPVAAPEVPEPEVPDDDEGVEAPEVPEDEVLGVTPELPEDDEDEVSDGDVSDGVVLDAASSSPAFDVSEDEAAPDAPRDTFSGATSSAVVLGTTSCVALLPPQADRPPPARSIRRTAVTRRRMGEARRLSRRAGPRGAPCAGRRSGSR